MSLIVRYYESILPTTVKNSSSNSRMRRRLNCETEKSIQRDDDDPGTQGTFSSSPRSTLLLLDYSHRYCYSYCRILSFHLLLLLRERSESSPVKFRSLNLVVVCVLVLSSRRRIIDRVVWLSCTPRTVVWWPFELSSFFLSFFLSVVVVYVKTCDLDWRREKKTSVWSASSSKIDFPHTKKITRRQANNRKPWWIPSLYPKRRQHL